MQKENKGRSSKETMEPHSMAKVELYGEYLSRYLNILSRAGFLKKIHIYDLMCGEGIYSDNSKGSPIITLEKVRDHYFQNKNTCPNLEILFNDRDKSLIEEGKYKIERVKEHASKLKIYKPENVAINYTNEDYVDLYPHILRIVKSLDRDERLLLFIDPYGYKEIKPDHLKELLMSKEVELILFLPISHMYRFAKPSLSDEGFVGGDPLKDFLSDLSFKNMESCDSTNTFIEQLKELFRAYLKECQTFVDTFTIERDKQNTYCLFFFTPHIKGFEVMLEAKWKLDEHQGKGFKLTSQSSLFTEVEITNYPQKLEKYISQVQYRTNAEVYKFGLENGFLPRHTNQVFQEWQKMNPKFKITSENGGKVRKSAFYISFKNYGNTPEKRVRFSLK